MTSLAFTMGVIPLMPLGSRSEMRQAIGVAFLWDAWRHSVSACVDSVFYVVSRIGRSTRKEKSDSGSRNSRPQLRWERRKPCERSKFITLIASPPSRLRGWAALQGAAAGRGAIPRSGS